MPLSGLMYQDEIDAQRGSRGKNLDDDYTKEGTELELKPTPFFLNVLLSNLGRRS